MPLPPKQRVAAIAASSDVAGDFLDDLNAARNLLNRNIVSRDEARKLSGVLRRFLLDKQQLLPVLAGPRLNRRLSLVAPDNNPFYASASSTPYVLFISGGIIGHRGILVVKDATHPDIHSLSGDFIPLPGESLTGTSALPRNIPNYDPMRTVALKLDNFLSQRVLCVDGLWISRKSVLRYAAYIASGVHPGVPDEEHELILRRLARSIQCSIAETTEGPRPRISINLGALHSTTTPEFKYTPNEIDVTLLEVMTAAHFVVTSPDILILESIIKTELNVT